MGRYDTLLSTANKMSKSESNKPTKLQVDNTTNVQVVLSPSRIVAKPVIPLIEKYTTHLRKEIIKAVKRIALENDRKDYEIVQEALDEYLKRHT
jgi:hypothetical protein